MNFLRNNFAAIILILSAIILRLLAALFPPSQILYSIDERIMVDSSLLLFTNSTPTCLEWPATTLMIPLFFFSFLCMIVSSDFVSAARHFDMIKISDVVNSHLYNNFNADDLIITGRILIALIGLISYFFLFNFLQGEKRVFKLFFIFLYTYSAAVITQSWVLHPDSAAIIFWVLFIAYYMFRFNLKDDRSIGWLALLYALLVASKFTYAIFFPILLLSFLFLNFPENKLKIVLTQSCKFLVISGILLLALLPFIWTNSLTFAKSFFGNIIVKSTGSGNSLYVMLSEYFPSLVTYPGIVLSIIGLLSGFKTLGRKKSVFLIVTFLVFAFPIANASQSYERYSLSLFPVLIIWASLGFVFITEKITNTSRLQVVATSILLFCFFQAATKIWGDFKSYHGQSNFVLCRKWIQLNINTDERIALPVSYDGFFYENKNCIERINKRNNDSLLIRDKFMTQLPFSYRAIPFDIHKVILEDIFMDEKKYLDQKTRIKFDFVSAHPIPKKAFDIYYYSASEFSSLHCYKYEDVVNDSLVNYILSENKQDSNLKLIMSFGNFPDMPYYFYSKK